MTKKLMLDDKPVHLYVFRSAGRYHGVCSHFGLAVSSGTLHGVQHRMAMLFLSSVRALGDIALEQSVVETPRSWLQDLGNRSHRVYSLGVTTSGASEIPVKLPNRRPPRTASRDSALDQILMQMMAWKPLKSAA